MLSKRLTTRRSQYAPRIFKEFNIINLKSGNRSKFCQCYKNTAILFTEIATTKFYINTFYLIPNTFKSNPALNPYILHWQYQVQVNQYIILHYLSIDNHYLKHSMQ